MPLYPTALITATLLGVHGLRKGSLSSSGAIAAFIVGYGHLATPVVFWGVELIAFYLIASRATKVKVAQKAKYEDGPSTEKPGGNRNAVQVLCNSLPTLLAALAYRFHYSRQIRPLIYLGLGHFSTALADTLASELGILSSGEPVHVLTLTHVPRGTNGGVSPLGLGVSLLGGAIMGVVGVIDILIESRSCVGGVWPWAAEMVLFSALAGLSGSLLDSILGATMQETRYDPISKKVLTDVSISAKGRKIKRIGFGKDVLSNSGVNFVSTAVLAAVGYWWGSRI